MAGGIFISNFSCAAQLVKEVRTMKVKCIKRYSDVRLNKIIEVGEVLEVDKDRAKHLVNEGCVEIVKESEKAAGKGKK